MPQRPPSLSAPENVASTNLELTELQTVEEKWNQLPLPPNGSPIAQALTKRVFALYQKEQEARKEAEQVNRMKDEFLAAVSHELRTPLTAILGWSQVLREVKTADDPAYVRGLDTIERCARAQQQLVDDLLDVTRIKTGKLRLHLAPVEPSAVIGSAIDALRPLADSKDLRMQFISTSKTASVMGDRNRLEQVIWNLLSNAIKFTPQGGSVLIQLERVNSHLQIRVTDTGEGIEPELLPDVFQPYRQPDGSKRHQGLGLGLAIVNHLVKLHHGTVRAESSGKQQGSCFTVRLPVIDAKAAAHTVGKAQINKKSESEFLQIVSTSLHSTRKLQLGSQGFPLH